MLFRLLAPVAILASSLSLSGAVPAPNPDPLSLGNIGGLLTNGGGGGGRGNGRGGRPPLISADILANILGPRECSANAVIGVKAYLNVLNLVEICACVEVLNILDRPHERACPTCPPHSHPICASANCSCKCDNGYYASATTGACVPRPDCPPPNTLVAQSDGRYVCQCAAGQQSTPSGGCAPVPSARARSRRANVAVAKRTPAEYILDGSDGWRAGRRDAEMCPEVSERACPVGTGGGYECLDTTNSLDSCGGCTSDGTGVNCLALPGVQGVSCKASQCHVSSCKPGYKPDFDGHSCIKAHA